MSKNQGANCCNANNVDRTNEVYVLPNTGRFALHQWHNELEGAAPVPKTEKAPAGARGASKEDRGDKGNQSETKQKIKEEKEKQKEQKKKE